MKQIRGKQNPLFWVAILAVAIIIATLYSFYIGRKITERYPPLMDAAMEIKYEATIAHLWFEELISGDRSIVIQDVWEHLDSSKWYAEVMLNGGENEEGTFLPLENEALRKKIKETLVGISKFRVIAEERFRLQLNSGVGSKVEQRFDKIFETFLFSADEVETTIQSLMKKQLTQFQILQYILISAILIFGIIIGFLLQWHERRHVADMQNLQEQKENLRTTLNSIGDGVIATDQNGNITKMNPIAEKLTGWNENEAKGKILTDVFNIVNALTREPAFNPVNKVLKDGKTVGLANHTILVSKDGREYQIADSAAPISNKENNISGVVLVFRDVTEEYRVLEELQQSEKKYRLFFENNDAIILLLNPQNGEIIFANKSAENFYGYSHEQFVGMNISNLNTIEPEEIKKKMMKAREIKQNYFIFKHKLADGSLRDVEIYQTKLMLDDQEIFSIIVHDITERILAEETLRQSEDRLLESQRVARLGYYVLNVLDGSWTSSTELNNIFGIGENFKRDIRGWQKLIHPEFADEMQNYLIDHVLTQHKEFDKEYKIITPETGEEKWVRGKGALKFDEENNPIEMFGTIQDITEKRMMIDDVIASKERAENADKMKSIFLAQMSHEIRTPINALVSMSSLLKYDFEEGADEDQLMSFEIIDRAGGRIIRTVDLLLNLSEIQAGTYEANPTKFDVFTEVISQIIAENKLIAKNKNIDLNLIYSVENSELVADHYTVNQIFTQLIDNAIKYTQEGQISVKILYNESKQLVVEIVDTGIGIEDEYLPNLFEPFSQEEMGYTRKYEGNGIGLALVKKYCELNNADIEVKSQKGIGSTFRVIFSQN